MAQDRPSSDADRLIIARISGIAMRHARWCEPSGDETAAAVAELREVAGDRPDLLAEEAGLLLGYYEGELGEPQAKGRRSFLIAAGADESLSASDGECCPDQTQVRAVPVRHPGARTTPEP